MACLPASNIFGSGSLLSRLTVMCLLQLRFAQLKRTQSFPQAIQFRTVMPRSCATSATSTLCRVFKIPSTINPQPLLILLTQANQIFLGQASKQNRTCSSCRSRVCPWAGSSFQTLRWHDSTTGCTATLQVRSHRYRCPKADVVTRSIQAPFDGEEITAQSAVALTRQMSPPITDCPWPEPCHALRHPTSRSDLRSMG